MDDTEFAARRRGLSTQLVLLLAAMFRALGSWRGPDVPRFLEQAVPTVAAGQETLAQLTAVHVAASAAEVFGVDVEVPALESGAFASLRTGVTPQQVYTRPFVALRTALSQGETLDAAVEAGVTRLGQIAEMDMQQTYAHASQAAMQALPARTRPQFWARVLQGTENCAMCVVASTQRYRRGDLNPIHPACDCLVKPLNTTTDPGQVIAPELLEQVHAAVEEMTGRTDRGARGPDYRKLMVAITDRHGELGELLHRPGDHFAGPRDVRP